MSKTFRQGIATELRWESEWQQRNSSRTEHWTLNRLQRSNPELELEMECIKIRIPSFSEQLFLGSTITTWTLVSYHTTVSDQLELTFDSLHYTFRLWSVCTTMVSTHSSSSLVAWRLLLLVLTLTSTQSARALKANGGLTTLELEMAEKGTFSYASLPESDMEELFENFIAKYSRKVIMKWNEMRWDLIWCTRSHGWYLLRSAPLYSVTPIPSWPNTSHCIPPNILAYHRRRSMRQLWRGASVTRTSNCSWKSWTSLTPLKYQRKSQARRCSASPKSPISLPLSSKRSSSAPRYRGHPRDNFLPKSPMCRHTRVQRHPLTGLQHWPRLLKTKEDAALAGK